VRWLPALLAASALPLTAATLFACDEGAPPSPGPEAPDWCAEAPVTTWHNFGHGFVIETCQPCHASTAVDRHEAPEDVTFDTPEDVVAQRERILLRATGLAPTMPPAGGVAAEQRARLEVWLSCDFDPLLRE